MIRYRSGNLLDSKAQTLVNTVNCVGVMGKGVALEFKSRFPAMYLDYRKLCERRLVKPGVPYAYAIGERQIVNFPTKRHWKEKSRLIDIEQGLSILASAYRGWNITSLALPPLGCGNGGLEWSDVRPLIEKHLGSLEIDVEVYVPLGQMVDDSAKDERAAPRPQQELFAFGRRSD